MNDTPDNVKAQAARLDSLMPAILRRICTLDEPRLELPVAQMRLCTLLMQGPMTMSALSREMGTTVSATTQLADRLEGVGYVERLAGEDDRRSRSLRLTKRGSAVMCESRDMRLSRWVEVLSRLPAPSRTAVVQLLEELVAACQTTLASTEGPPHEARSGRAVDILAQVERS